MNTLEYRPSIAPAVAATKPPRLVPSSRPGLTICGGRRCGVRNCPERESPDGDGREHDGTEPPAAWHAFHRTLPFRFRQQVFVGTGGVVPLDILHRPLRTAAWVLLAVFSSFTVVVALLAAATLVSRQSAAFVRCRS